MLKNSNSTFRPILVFSCPTREQNFIIGLLDSRVKRSVRNRSTFGRNLPLQVRRSDVWKNQGWVRIWWRGRSRRIWIRRCGGRINFLFEEDPDHDSQKSEGQQQEKSTDDPQTSMARVGRIFGDRFGHFPKRIALEAIKFFGLPCFARLLDRGQN